MGKHVNLGLMEPENLVWLKNGIGESRGQFDNYERHEGESHAQL